MSYETRFCTRHGRFSSWGGHEGCPECRQEGEDQAEHRRRASDETKGLSEQIRDLEDRIGTLGNTIGELSEAAHAAIFMRVRCDEREGYGAPCSTRGAESEILALRNHTAPSGQRLLRPVAVRVRCDTSPPI